MNTQKIKDAIRNIPDFPIPGIQFKDVTTLFKDPERLSELIDILYELYKDKGITKVVGIESRGFIAGPLLAVRLKAGFIPIRKPGKLPAACFEESYEKEYGTDTIQIHQDAISSDDIVLLHDDLLATGGTMLAAVRLVEKFHPEKIYVNFIVELEELKGRGLFSPDIQVDSIVQYDI
ncbi:adenine phosphoribosyltransferase [Bacteroidales bacterium OttesenSCG-928-A17]|nr:adenine phosphoribosyltransferase [Bacteroidales bacterium OttesenSCG-928-A17]